MSTVQKAKSPSIRSKLLVAMIGIAFISTALLMVVVFKDVSSEMVFQFHRHAKTINQNVKTFLALTARHIEQLSMSILANDDIQSMLRKINRGNGTPEELETFSRYVENELLKVTLGRDEIRGIFLIVDNGPTVSLVLDPAINLNAVDAVDLARIEAAAGSPVWLNTDKNSKAIPMGRVYVDTISQKPTGVLLIFFTEEYFSNIFEVTQTNGDEQTFLLADNGHVVSHPDKSILGNRLNAQYVDRLLNSNTDDVFLSIQDNGQNSNLWGFHMPAFRWWLVYITPSAVIQAPAKALQYRMFLIGFVCWIVAILLGLLISRGISEPIQRLLNAIRGFSATNKYQRVAWSSQDEIGQAVCAYNTLLDQLEKAELELYEANKAKGDFLMNMSHELRTPLNGILMAAELIDDGKSILPGNEIKKIISVSGNNLLTLIQRILDFTQSKRGELETDCLPFKLDEAISGLKRQFNHRGVTTELSLKIETSSSNIPNNLIGDGPHLVEILNLLLENSAKFVETLPEATLKIDLIEDNKTRIRLRFSLTDNGIGIAEKFHQKIFDPFFQVDGSLTRKYEGIGIGLAICKQLVELMQGEIGVASKPAEGSTFYLQLDFEKQAAMPFFNTGSLQW